MFTGLSHDFIQIAHEFRRRRVCIGRRSSSFLDFHLFLDTIETVKFFTFLPLDSLDARDSPDHKSTDPVSETRQSLRKVATQTLRPKAATATVAGSPECGVKMLFFVQLMRRALQGLVQRSARTRLEPCPIHVSRGNINARWHEQPFKAKR